jgi:hypothetical protein
MKITPIVSRSHTHPSHSQTSRLLTSSLSSLSLSSQWNRWDTFLFINLWTYFFFPLPPSSVPDSLTEVPLTSPSTPRYYNIPDQTFCWPFPEQKSTFEGFIGFTVCHISKVTFSPLTLDCFYSWFIKIIIHTIKSKCIKQTCWWTLNPSCVIMCFPQSHQVTWWLWDLQTILRIIV